MTTTQQFCTFFLGDHLFGIAVEEVQEVIQHQDMTRVPLAPDGIRGLINLRGQIVMAVDLRRRLRIGAPPPGTSLINVVIRTQEGPVSLLVDSIGDVVEVDETTAEPPPHTLQADIRTLIAGVHKLDQGLMQVLNTEKACQPLEPEA